MDIIKDNPFWEEKRVYSKAEAWIYLQTNDISIRETSKLFGWSTTKLYTFLRELNITPKKTPKNTLQKSVSNSKTTTSNDAVQIKKTVEKTPKKTLEQRKNEFAQKLIPFVEKYGKEMIRAFFDYWSEHNENGHKMSFEKKTTFSIPHRLRTWERLNKDKYGRTTKNNREQRVEDSAKRKEELLKYANSRDSEDKELIF